MSAFFRQFKIITLIIVLLVVLAAIWLFPLYYGWDEIMPITSLIIQFLTTTLLLLVAGIFFYIYYRYKKNNIAKDLAETSATEDTVTEQMQLTYQQEEKHCFAYFKTIFQCWGRQKRHLLRKSPWYLVIGEDGSGKAKLLDNSGLDLLNKSSLDIKMEQLLVNSSVSANYAHAWHFSRDAVFIELPLNPSDVAADSATKVTPKLNNKNPFWLAFLKFIKRYRRKMPLNGILLTLEPAQLLRDLETQNNATLKELKNLLQSIYHRLQIQIPVYLILTKCDLVAGFREFFADLDKDEREQVWGIAFPKTAFAHQRQATDSFNQEYDKWIARLHERVLTRMEAERDRDSRALISYFPEQLQMCKQWLTDFVVSDETMQLRGVYFTSSMQDGMPYDFIMAKLVKQYDLEETTALQHLPQQKPYFIKRLFTDVILPDTDWHFYSHYFQQQKARHYQISWAVAAGIVVLSTLGFTFSYSYNKNNLQTLAQYLPDYEQAATALPPSDKNLASALPALDSAKNLHKVYADTAAKPLVYFELYEPLRIRSQINTFWQNNLSYLLMPRVAARIEKQINQDQQVPEVLYHALKGYLVFDADTPNADPKWLKLPIEYDLAINLKNNRDEQNQLRNYLEEAIHYPITPIPLNKFAIAKARERLRNIPPLQFAYYELKQDGSRSYSQYNLEDKIGENFSNLFVYAKAAAENGIPGIYTLNGYRSLQGKRSDLLIEHTAESYHILGLDRNENTRALTAEMTPQLWAFYNADYIQNWQELLDSIQIAPFANLPQAVNALNVLTSNKSPLLKLLMLVKENTYPVYGRYLHINQQFSTLNNITGLPHKPSVQYQAIQKNLIALRDYLTTLSSAPNTNQLEFQDASAILQNKSPTNPIVILKEQAQQMPAPLNKWLTEISDNSLKLLLQGAHQTIDIAWQTNVLSYYHSDIQGRFPFNSQTDAYVSITSFGAFFGNDGILAKFLQTYLQPFVDINSSWSQYQVGGYSLGLSSATLSELQRADLIRKMYFQNGDNTAAAQFSIQPRFLDPQSSSVYVQLANQNLTYRHGPPEAKSWRWPAAADVQQASISFSDFQGHNSSFTADGPWAWFKLLNKGQLQATDAGHYIWTITQNNRQASFDVWAPNNLPLFDLKVLEQFSIPEHV